MRFIRYDKENGGTTSEVYSVIYVLLYDGVNFLAETSACEWRSLQAVKQILLRVKIQLIVVPGSYIQEKDILYYYYRGF